MAGMWVPSIATFIRASTWAGVSRDLFELRILFMVERSSLPQQFQRGKTRPSWLRLTELETLLSSWGCKRAQAVLSEKTGLQGISCRFCTRSPCHLLPIRTSELDFWSRDFLFSKRKFYKIMQVSETCQKTFSACFQQPSVIKGYPQEVSFACLAIIFLLHLIVLCVFNQFFSLPLRSSMLMS